MCISLENGVSAILKTFFSKLELLKKKTHGFKPYSIKARKEVHLGG
jgi:hypothetical protein